MRQPFFMLFQTSRTFSGEALPHSLKYSVAGTALAVLLGSVASNLKKHSQASFRHRLYNIQQPARDSSYCKDLRQVRKIFLLQILKNILRRVSATLSKTFGNQRGTRRAVVICGEPRKISVKQSPDWRLAWEGRVIECLDRKFHLINSRQPT